MKTGKIKFITPKGKAKPFTDPTTGEEIINNRYLVGFADGSEWTFSARAEFRHEVGSEISYEIANEQYKLAKKATAIKKNVTNVTNNRPVNTNDSILLQVCYKENMQAFGKENRSVVINNTQEDFISLKQILNNL